MFGKILIANRGEIALRRITSYNVCYTKLLRRQTSLVPEEMIASSCSLGVSSVRRSRSEAGNGMAGAGFRISRITSYNVCYTKLLRESLQLTRFVLDYVNGRVPVVASGHTACGMSQQIDQLGKIAETGVDSVILISNRLAMPNESDATLLANLQKITAAVTDKVGLGIYECPHPYKRLLSDDVVRWCAQSGRYTFIKDTSYNFV